MDLCPDAKKKIEKDKKTSFRLDGRRNTEERKQDFSINKDGTVYDRVTGLVWLRCPYGQFYDNEVEFCEGKYKTFSIDDAMKVASEFSIDEGAKDWRVPNRWEMETIAYCSSGMQESRQADMAVGPCAGKSRKPNVIPEIFNWAKTDIYDPASYFLTSSQQNKSKKYWYFYTLSDDCGRSGFLGIGCRYKGMFRVSNDAKSYGALILVRKASRKEIKKIEKEREKKNEQRAMEVRIRTASIVMNEYRNLASRKSDFVINADGTVHDKETDLIWMLCSAGQVFKGNKCIGDAKDYRWQEAIDMAKSFSFAGQNDWRLPNRWELETLVHCTSGVQEPRDKDYKYFNSCKGDYSKPTTVQSVFSPESFLPANFDYFYWSSSTVERREYNAWGVDFNNGQRIIYNKDFPRQVRLVRSKY